MPINQLIIYTIDVVIISSNIFLSRFLYQQTSNNSGQVMSDWSVNINTALHTALNASDCKKNRKKNFVPASVGILAMVLLSVYTSIAAFLIYQSEDYDNGTRAFIWNALNDFFFCLLSPMVLLYGAPSVRWKVTRLLRSPRFSTQGEAQQNNVTTVKPFEGSGSGVLTERNMKESQC